MIPENCDELTAEPGRSCDDASVAAPKRRMPEEWNHAARGIDWAVGLHTQRPTDGAARLSASRKALRQFVRRCSVCQERRGAPAAAPRRVRAPSGSGGRGGEGDLRPPGERRATRGAAAAPRRAASCRAVPAAAPSGLGAATTAARHWEVRRGWAGARRRVERQSRVTAGAPREQRGRRGNRGGDGALAVARRARGRPCGGRRRGGRARRTHPMRPRGARRPDSEGGGGYSVWQSGRGARRQRQRAPRGGTGAPTHTSFCDCWAGP